MMIFFAYSPIPSTALIFSEDPLLRETLFSSSRVISFPALSMSNPIFLGSKKSRFPSAVVRARLEGSDIPLQLAPFWRMQLTAMAFRSSSSGKYKDTFVPVSGIQYTFPPEQSGGGLSKSFPYPAPRGKGTLWKHPASYQSLNEASPHPLRFLSLCHGWTGPQTWGYRQVLPTHRRPCPGYRYNGTLPAKAGYVFPLSSTCPPHRRFSPQCRGFGRTPPGNTQSPWIYSLTCPRPVHRNGC